MTKSTIAKGMGVSRSLVPVAGKVWTDGIDGPFLDGEETFYSRYIYIPITLEEGKVMSYYAEQLRDENGEGIYNLYARNCGMVAQDILETGGKNFAAGSEKGKNIDEQQTLMKIGVSIIAGHPISIKKILDDAVEKDRSDQTIPNAAYEKGVREATTAGWNTGKIERCD